MKNPAVRVLNRSCPAVSQICIFSFTPFTSSIWILKSTAIVVRWFTRNSFLLNRWRMQVFPTPDAPINMIFTSWS